MKRKSYLLLLIVVLLLVVGQQYDVYAQGCVQCRLGPSSNLEGGGNAARGINRAIMYLMAIPYLLLSTLAVYVFRKRLNKKWILVKQYFNAQHTTK